VLVTFLQANADMLTWTPSDMLDVPKEVIEHHLAVFPQARPVKQKTRCQALEKQDFIIQEIEKLKQAKFYLCMDFTSLNKACPKDPYPLPRID
jgi:hypothetical protein